VLKGYDVMKRKSSYRTLPLIPHIEEELLTEQARQEEMRKIRFHDLRHPYVKLTTQKLLRNTKQKALDYSRLVSCYYSAVRI